MNEPDREVADAETDMGQTMLTQPHPNLHALRRDPTPNQIGKLPKVWCGECRRSKTLVCDAHRKLQCGECHSYITNAHNHIDFVGHAAVTDILLEADPLWNWEPLALASNGLPQFDEHRGLWIKLTVCGVTRLGYGSAVAKNDKQPVGDLIKEIIGDALRNASMRFGVGLSMWHKGELRPGDEDGGIQLTSSQLYSKVRMMIMKAGSRVELDEAAGQIAAAQQSGKLNAKDLTRLRTELDARLVEHLSPTKPAENRSAVESQEQEQAEEQKSKRKPASPTELLAMLRAADDVEGVNELHKIAADWYRTKKVSEEGARELREAIDERRASLRGEP